jgi:hypothetical protein
MSNNVILLSRIFRERLEVDHHPIGSSNRWTFTLAQVGKHGRRVVGNHRDVARAFAAARILRDRGVRIVAIDRGRP